MRVRIQNYRPTIISVFKMIVQTLFPYLNYLTIIISVFKLSSNHCFVGVDAHINPFSHAVLWFVEKPDARCAPYGFHLSFYPLVCARKRVDERHRPLQIICNLQLFLVLCSDFPSPHNLQFAICNLQFIPKWYIRPAAAVKHAFLMRERRKAVHTMIAPHAAFPNAAKRQMVVG